MVISSIRTRPKIKLNDNKFNFMKRLQIHFLLNKIWTPSLNLIDIEKDVWNVICRCDWAGKGYGGTLLSSWVTKTSRGNQSQSEREISWQTDRQTGRLIETQTDSAPTQTRVTHFNVQTGALASLCSLHPSVIPQTSRPPLHPPASLSTRPVNTASVLNQCSICTLFWPTSLIPAHLGQFPGGTLQMGKHF